MTKVTFDLERAEATTNRRLSLRTRRTLVQLLGAGALLLGAGLFLNDLQTTLWSSRSDSEPFAAWGIESPSPAALTAGLSAWPPKPPPTSDTPQALADAAYDYGPRGDAYRASLIEFAHTFPPHIAGTLVVGLEEYFAGGGRAWDANKTVWQTDRPRGGVDPAPLVSWELLAGDDGWETQMLSDADAEAFVASVAGDNVQLMWDSMPIPVMKADLLRYLLLLLRGGIYTDTDTFLLKPPHAWGANAALWRGGAWLSDAQRTRIAAEGVDAVLGRPAVVVGIEADAGQRHDWADWWPRPLQLAQWTMGMAPGHPIALSALLRALHRTARAATWAADHTGSVLAEPRDGGPLGVVEWTGPGIWTDAVVAHLRELGMGWAELRELDRPVRVGEVVVLPVTGFSPGVNNFDAGGVDDPQAMVQHLFRGSWKEAAEAGD